MLLRTKLFIPPSRPNLVPRPQLIDRLNQGLPRGSKLILLSAPAGFGKSTLVSEWLAGRERLAAWLSLDEGDNDLSRFLAYLVASLQQLALSEVEGFEAQHAPLGNFGEGVLAMLHSPQPPPTESILTALLNEITAIPSNFVLVLDDYHLIDAQVIDKALAFLIEGMPSQMRLVIATREDPTLPLARLRVRGQLIELRVSDLRFSNAEAAGFLNQVMGLELSAEEIVALESRTEGWIAGLQMAALALQGLAMQGQISRQGRGDTAAFIQAFTGSHHFVLDYLVEEVLGRQPEHVRNFLFQTSILDRLSGPLCDAVRFGFAKSPSSSSGSAVESENGKQMLAALERGNLFLVPLDEERHWYRYHHLFGDVLQAYLMEERPDQVPTLHRRASEWYEQNGLCPLSS